LLSDPAVLAQQRRRLRVPKEAPRPERGGQGPAAARGLPAPAAHSRNGGPVAVEVAPGKLGLVVGTVRPAGNRRRRPRRDSGGPGERTAPDVDGGPGR